MHVSNQTEYGLRAAVTLARLWPAKFVQSRELAEQEKLPSKFLEAILLTLRRGGFLESKVGRDGGYRLCARLGKFKWESWCGGWRDASPRRSRVAARI